MRSRPEPVPGAGRTVHEPAMVDSVTASRDEVATGDTLLAQPVNLLYAGWLTGTSSLNGETAGTFTAGRPATRYR